MSPAFLAYFLTIASFVKEGAKVADIGADHGLLSIYLVKNKQAQKVFAVENKIGPFSILEKNTKKYPEITCSLSDGISEIPEDIDTLVVAGMGGILISDILIKNKDKLENIQNIVIDAHRDQELVRKTLNDLGFEFQKEVLVKEGVYYHVMSVVRGENKLTSSELEFGYNIKLDPLFEEYRANRINRLEQNYEKNNSYELKAKIERLKQL